MKYMGSKRSMLKNGLGHLLERELTNTRNFADLFTGSAAVALHVAQRFDIEVRAYDLQQYSAVLANAVLSRETILDWEKCYNSWIKDAGHFLQEIAPPSANNYSESAITSHRNWCANQDDWPITKAYGGHYFSAKQAIWIDALRRSLPTEEPIRTVALAALIQAASQCAAAPGHTAQPFQPTETASKFIQDAWQRDLVQRVKNNIEVIAAQHVKRKGISSVRDANDAAQDLKEGDVAFIDPPYSGVHYSRFYHVLETIASGFCGEVEGKGRYPAPSLRPKSKYSISTQSASALSDLFQTLSYRGARAILTFPDHDCSNGLSGDMVRELANKHFKIREEYVASKFSTLGGTGGKSRNARKEAKELILSLYPK